MTSREWMGDNPYYLMFVAPEPVMVDPDVQWRESLRIDLDERGWMAKYPDLFRSAGELHLVRKSDDVIVLSVNVNPGEQSYYVARHIGFATGGAGETTAYGIGKKRVDGNEDNLWYLPWDQVCGGKDVEYFALAGLKRGLA